MKEIEGWKSVVKRWSFLLGIVIGPFLFFVSQWIDHYVHDLFLGVLLTLITIGPFIIFYIYGFLGFDALGNAYCLAWAKDFSCPFAFVVIFSLIVSAIWWCFLLWFVPWIRSKGQKQVKS